MAQTAAAQKPQPTQTFENHTRLVPIFHMFALPVLALNFLYAAYHLVRAFSVGAAMGLLVAAALIVVALEARVFALKVQDRLIRLEMRLRLAGTLPADLRSRIPEFTLNQLVALRFASDAELPELARRVLDGNIQERKAIKRMVRDWQADFLRV